MSINKVFLSGNLTRTPEVRQIANGNSIISFSVAVNERVKDGSEWTDRPNYIDCTLFTSSQKSLEWHTRKLEKGVGVVVSGRLRWESWEKDGQKRSAVRVVVDDIEYKTKYEQAQEEYTKDVSSVYDEDIPF